jgi:hypothetical protein
LNLQQLVKATEKYKSKDAELTAEKEARVAAVASLEQVKVLPSQPPPNGAPFL